MKSYKDIILGVLLGLLVTLIGCVLFLGIFTSVDFSSAYQFLKTNGYLGKIVTLGALFNVGIVFLLYKKNKDQIAKGVILSIFILTIYTLFV